jgi:4-amino-4-deoxy-L-arabinose transferase-like glycosyltransferase
MAVRTAPVAGQERLRQGLTVIVFMWVFLAQLALGSRHLSLTTDEPSHVMNGYVALVTADTWAMLPHTHPPLVNAWSALPLLLQPERPEPHAVPYWGQDFDRFLRSFSSRLGPVERLAFVTRFPVMLLAVVLMALVYRWARDWFGHWGGVLAVAVMAWDPTLIAHSQLNTTDLGVTLFAFACLYLVDRLLRRFSWRLLVGVGLLLGAALATKPSGVILVPVVVALFGWGYVRQTGAGWWAFLRRRETPPSGLGGLLSAGGRWLSYAAAVVAIGVLFLWATYRFEWRTLPGMSQPLPLATHIRMVQLIFSEKSWAFVWGERRPGGWWWYFPFAFAVKTPIPVIVGLGAALVVAARQRGRWLWQEVTLWSFPVVYAMVAIQSGLNIGYRHLLPVLPFAYVAMGRLATWLFDPWGSRWRWVVRAGAVALGVWYILGTLRVYPFALAYFNEFVGGPRNGYHYLVDSNVDWGQSFKALKTYMDAAGIDEVSLSYNAWIDPAVYGVRYTPLPPAPGTESVLLHRYDPVPGVYVIGATTLQGIMFYDPDLYEWFRHREPVAQPGYGLLVYQVSPHLPPARWVAQCTVPVAPLKPNAVRKGFGRDDLRLVYFDCTRSRIYPEGGRSTGWYGLFRDTWRHGDGFLRGHLAPARLSYQQIEFQRSPAFVLFESNTPHAPLLAGIEREVGVAPADWSPDRVEAQAVLLTAPVQLNGPLTFLGYQVLPSTKKLELWTTWRVEAIPERPLSIMAHLVGADGVAIAVGDGLGVPIDQWQVGDVLVQRHQLAVPQGTQPRSYWLRTGAYWLDTLERWTVADASGSDALFMSVRWLP